jgi:RimJ/RimL family protein N-acetyltransferase
VGPGAEGVRRVPRRDRLCAPDGWPGFEIAWTLARRCWRHGYATEAARAALEHAFTVWKKDRVISLINPENRASIRVAERLGESLQGRHEMGEREYLVYGIARASYRALTSATAT